MQDPLLVQSRRDVPLSLCPETKIIPCPIVPLSHCPIVPCPGQREGEKIQRQTPLSQDVPGQNYFPKKRQKIEKGRSKTGNADLKQKNSDCSVLSLSHPDFDRKMVIVPSHVPSRPLASF